MIVQVHTAKEAEAFFEQPTHMRSTHCACIGGDGVREGTSSAEEAKTFFKAHGESKAEKAAEIPQSPHDMVGGDSQ